MQDALLSSSQLPYINQAINKQYDPHFVVTTVGGNFKFQSKGKPKQVAGYNYPISEAQELGNNNRNINIIFNNNIYNYNVSNSPIINSTSKKKF